MAATLLTEKTDMSPLDIVRKTCLDKGAAGFTDIRELFSTLDKNDSASLSVHEFINGLQKMGFEQKKTELYKVFKEFDADKSKDLTFQEFLAAVSPPMPEKRAKLVKECLERTGAITDGNVDINIIKEQRTEKAKGHPKYKADEWTISQVLESYFDFYAYDSECSSDGKIAGDDLMNYYSALSANITEDSTFENNIKTSFSIE